MGKYLYFQKKGKKCDLEKPWTEMLDTPYKTKFVWALIKERQSLGTSRLLHQLTVPSQDWLAETPDAREVQVLQRPPRLWLTE